MPTFIKLTLFYKSNSESTSDNGVLPVWVNASHIATIQPQIAHQLSRARETEWIEAKKTNQYISRPANDLEIPYTLIEFAVATAEDTYGLNVRETPERILQLIHNTNYQL